MEAKAIAKKVRISADKARLVVNLIRGKNINEAMSILKNMNKKAARIVEKVLISAVANAENNHNLNKEKLYVSKAYVNEDGFKRTCRKKRQKNKSCNNCR